MTDCLKNDPVFTNMIKAIGIEPNDRKRIYYTICIFTRLLLAGWVLQYHDKKILHVLMLIFSAIGIGIIYPKLDGEQWWSRRFHLFIAIMIFLLALYLLNGGEKQFSKYLAYLMYLDVGVGVAMSLMKPWCSL
uniref:Uncharacterized protein n=1 Tax=viral metagenome TaxID=1070528 RepID=A0A6C0ECD5_9ZZZZ